MSPFLAWGDFHARSRLARSTIPKEKWGIDCKTVRIFAYSSKREQSNERSGTSLKTESETGGRRFYLSREARALRACKTLTPRFTDFLTDFEKKKRLFCSLNGGLFVV